MRKGFLMVLAVVLVAAMAAPAMADFSTSGFIRIKGHTEQNYTNGASGGSFILPGKDVNTSSYVEQRMRFIFDWKGENVGARYYGEIDYTQWGDSAYNTSRNTGGALEADTVNLESKNIYMWFNVPNTSVKVTAGMQNQSDSFGGMIFGYADMAGIFLTGNLGNLAPVSYKLGWARFQQNQGGTTVAGNTALANRLDSAVDLYVAEAKFAPVKEARIGLDLYVLRDASGNKTTYANGETNLGNTLLRGFTDYGYAPGTMTYDPSVFYWIGLDGAFNAGPVELSGYAFYNFGKIEKANEATLGIVDQDIDVKAWAADLRADATVGPGKFFIEGAYVSGSGSDDSDFKSPITASNYALAASYPLTSMDMQILFPNTDDITASSALAYDIQNKGRGIIAVAAGYRMKFTDMLSGKVGVGYLTDAKNFVGTSAGGVGIKKHKATEVNANVNYALVKGLDLGLYGAYGFLSDWEDYGGKQGATNATGANMNEKADDIYKAMFRLNYAF